jgi:hypothetical protein
MHNSRPFPYSPRATTARAPLAYKYCSQHQQQTGGFFGGERAVLKERGGRCWNEREGGGEDFWTREGSFETGWGGKF